MQGRSTPDDALRQGREARWESQVEEEEEDEEVAGTYVDDDESIGLSLCQSLWLQVTAKKWTPAAVLQTADTCSSSVRRRRKKKAD